MDLVDFETKINQLRLVGMDIRVSKEMLFLASFLTSLLTRITSAPSNSKSEEANVLLLDTVARAKLLYGDVEGTKTDMDKAWAVLDRLEGVDNGVNAAYYQVAGDYYKLMHPILDAPDSTPHEWIKKLLFTFTEGNIGKFKALAPLSNIHD
ncbi:hypothetical protein C8J57DRAFT_1570228 [Mycena rebaudengoi]|nr:hypothetical protein C8J57DRAFT_1570228 [Mycena rebaudengoi]